MTITAANAGAGSGKTKYLAQWLVEHIVRGTDPSKIIATTFTRAAAAQLKARLQAGILNDKRISEDQDPLEVVEKLEFATIGTVNAIGAEMLNRFALRRGLSPNLQTLDETAQQGAFAEMLNSGNYSKWQSFTAIAQRFETEDPASLIQDLIAAARINRIEWPKLHEQLEDGAQRLITIMKHGGGTANSLRVTDAEEYVVKAIDELIELAQSGVTAASATTKATSMYEEIGTLRGTWPDFMRVVKNKKFIGGRGDRAKEILAPLGDLARSVLSSKHLHKDVLTFAQKAADAAADLGETYREFKAERGLVDFTDQETRFLDLLLDERLEGALRAEFEIVAVDEFRDTNPMQLAIFLRLNTLAHHSLWVGDGKQAIYSFRDADPELVTAVWEAQDAKVPDGLGRNQRSCAGLVELVGQLFEPVFGKDAVQGVVEDKINPRAVERWIIASDARPNQYAALAAGLQQLHAEGRPWGEIAVLIRTNDHLRDLASTLREQSIPVLAAVPGLFQKRECAVALAGLEVVADATDALASATVLHLLEDAWQGSPAWLESRLVELADGKKPPIPFADAPVLAAIRHIIDEMPGPSEALARVVDVLNLPSRFAQWGEPAERSVNIDTLLDLARSYETRCIASGSPATISGLLIWFEECRTNDKDNLRPPGGVDAVTVTTYHKCKGLEWKVVVLYDLDNQPRPRLWGPMVSGGDPSADDPLAGRRTRLWVWPFGKMKFSGALCDEIMAGAEGEEAARREEAERRRLLYVGFTRAEEVLVIAHQRDKTVWLDELTRINELLPLDPPGGWESEADAVLGIDFAIPGVATNCVLRHLAPPEDDPIPPASIARWLSPAESTARCEPRYANPSTMASPVGRYTPKVFTLTGAAPADAGNTSGKDLRRNIGNAVHDYLAALPSLVSMVVDAKLEVAARCISQRGLHAHIEAREIVSAGDTFSAWVDEHFPGATWLTEAPVTAARAEGGQWRGAIDLVLDLGDDRLVVIDHKSTRLGEGGAATVALGYAGQIWAYREALETQGYHVESGWIHFPLAGMVVRLDH